MNYLGSIAGQLKKLGSEDSKVKKNVRKAFLVGVVVPLAVTTMIVS